MATYNRDKLNGLIRQHREIAASIQTFNRLRENARTAFQRQRVLIDKADAAMYKAIESKSLKPLSKMPLDETLQSWDDFHPSRTHLARGTIQEFVEFSHDLAEIEEQLNEMTENFTTVDRIVSSCIEFLESKNLPVPRVRL